MPVELILDLPMEVQHELKRQPWLSEAERLSIIIDGSPIRYTEDEMDDAKLNSYEEGKADGCCEQRAECASEIDAILDKFDVDEPDYATQVVAAINAWLKENL